MPKKSVNVLKGAIFEWFIRNLLENCGFTQVEVDDKIIYTSGSGLMIHGLGQAHNADVLMNPPIQIPFYFPSRLLVECKCQKEKVGLPQVRNVLGLREDINHFEVLTPEMLKKRRNPRRGNPVSHNHKRVTYQVALASVKDFKATAMEFATTHRIPLISLAQSGRYKTLRDTTEQINEDFISHLDNRNQYESWLKFFKGNDEDMPREVNNGLDEVLTQFVRNSEKLFNKFFIGVLSGGEILLLYNHSNEHFQPSKLEYSSRIYYFREDPSNWYFQFKANERDTAPIKLFFELPKQIYDEWAANGFDRQSAIDRKEGLKIVTVFGKVNNNVVMFTLRLDLFWIKEVRDNASWE